MKDAFLKLYTRMQVLRSDCGQDLVEYALVVALIALAAVAGMQTLAGNINTAFGKVGTNLGTYIS
jgi:pilus assembly protein Flp/PilA